MSHPLVSVIVPVYNAEKHLTQAVKGIIGQTLENIEIIFVDDGSMDSSLEILKSFQKNDPRIRIISQPNSNAGKARNTGLDVATGEYLSFLDSDDLFEPEMLKRMFNEAKRYNADIVVCDSDVFDNETKLPLDTQLSLKSDIVSTDDVFSADDYIDVIFNFSFNVCWNKLFLHSFIKGKCIRFQEIKIHNDTFFAMTTLAVANRIKIVNEKFVHYRRNQNSQLSARESARERKLYVLSAFEVVADFFSRCPNRNKLLLSFSSIALNYSYYHLQSFGFEHDEYFKNMIANFWRNKLGNAELSGVTNSNYINLKEIENPGFIKGYFNAPYKAMPYEYIAPEDLIKPNQTIILYGAGTVGLDYYLQLTLDSNAENVTWVDSRSELLSSMGYPIRSVTCVSELEFDFVVVAVLHPNAVSEIIKTLTTMGIPREKICWPKDLSLLYYRKHYSGIKIAVAGIGYAGLANAVMLSGLNKVSITDIVQSKVDLVNARISPIDDDEIKVALKMGSFDLTAFNADRFDYSAFFFVIIATPTNYDEKKGKFDTKSVESVICSVLDTNREAVIVIRSTVPIGFTRSMNERYKTDRIVFAPEFLREGKALYDCKNPSRIVVGGKPTLAEAVANVLAVSSEKQDTETLITGTDEAEAVKLFSNAYLAMRVAYFNEISTFSIMKNLSAGEIVRGVCLDPRIGDGYNNPSFGYGGYCLPKDTKQLSSAFEEVPNSIVSAIVKANESRKRFVADELLKRQGVIGIYRLTMKSGSDNFRDSSVVYVLKMLLDKKREVIVYEPLLRDETFSGCPIIKELSEFKTKSDVVVTNRVTMELSDVVDKVFTCDIFGRD